MLSEAAADELVKKDVAAGVALLTFNRPEQHNAWNVPMEQQYFRLLEDCAEDPDVRVIVVTGAGRSFCPGLEMGLLSHSAETGATSNAHLRQPFTTPRTIPKPIIAAINGACAGLGLVAAMNCDLRFAASTAKITTAFVRRGIMAEHGLAWSLQQATSASVAMDLLLSGRVILAPEAHELGVVDRVYKPEDLMRETMLYAYSLAQDCSPIAMGTIKRQVYAAQESSHEEARIMALSFWMGVLRHHSDYKEGIRSFQEKRTPNFAPWNPATPAVPPPLPRT
jgi:enoyl-CoA hydratase/carnithine racemase